MILIGSGIAMVRKVLQWANYALVSTALILALFVLLAAFRSPSRAALPLAELQIQKNPTLPKNGFEQPAAAYADIGSPVLVATIEAPKLELPDLRPFLNYFGTNDRPDIGAHATQLYFSLKGADTVVGVPPREHLYLKYDATKRPGVYIFSPDNQPTNLWIEADKEDNKANVTVKMTDDAGNLITEPAIRGSVVLIAKDFARPGGAWEIGKWKVDGTLLARQRARWFGQDQFLNQHGGEEYNEYKDKERIEFGEGNDRYSVYVKLGDCLIWDGQRWQKVQVGESSRNFPLMCVQKLDDRLMRLELWDVNGQGHVSLNLVKSKEAWAPKTYEQDFKFISPRTLSQYVFEVRKERMVLRPYDWLLLTDKGWKPLVSVEDIDAFVDRKTQGVLFVFEGPVPKDDQQVLKAILYSPARTETYEMDFPLEGNPMLGAPRQEEQPTPAETPAEQDGGGGEEGTSGSEENATEPAPTQNTEEEAGGPPNHNLSPSGHSIPTVREMRQQESTHPDTESPEEAPYQPFAPKQQTEPEEEDSGNQDEQNSTAPPDDTPDSTPIPKNTQSRESAQDGDSVGQVAEVLPPKTRKNTRQPGRLREDIRMLLQDITK